MHCVHDIPRNPRYHGLCGSNKLLAMCLFNGRTEIWTPHSCHFFHLIFLKFKTKKHIWDRNPHAKFDKDQLSWGVVWVNTSILAVHSVLPFLFFCTLRSASWSHHASYCDHEGSKRMFPAKEVPFGVLTMKSNI